MGNAPAEQDMDGLLQQGGPVPTKGLTAAIHIGEADVPFVDIGDGSSLQVLQVDLTQGLWVVRIKFQPGYTVDTHYHTGPVYAVTLGGSWYYKEYPQYVNRAGSYLFEPAHSVHTLTVSEDSDEPADVWFAVHGVNVNIDDKGNVTGIVDAHGMLGVYRALCEAQGLSHAKMIVHGE